MHIHIYIFIVFLTTLTHLTGQVKYGNVSIEELTKSQSTIDENAPAEIISKDAFIEVGINNESDGFKMLKQIEVRIKIFDKDKTSDDYLKVEIPMYKLKQGKEKITNIKATTYNLEKGEIVKTNLKNNQIFKEQKSEYVRTKTFAFPNVKNGSIIEYKYTIQTPRFYDLDTYFFQEEIPVLHSKFNIRYPAFFAYSKDLRGGEMTDIKTTTYGTIYDYDMNSETVELYNIPGLENEPFVLNPDNMRSSIRYELREYNLPGVGYKNFSIDWPTILKNLIEDKSFGRELKGNNFLNDDVKQFKDIVGPYERMSSIFQYVKENYAWNGYDGLYPKNGVKQTFKDKSGNGSDLNFILISMLNKANIAAYPLVMSTIDNGILNLNPSLAKLNHTLTMALIDNKIYLMDPKDRLSQINLLPMDDLNSQGFVMLNKKDFRSIDLNNRLTSEIKTSLVYALEDGVLSGKMNQTKNNYFAMNDLKMKADDENNFQGNLLSDVDADILKFKIQENRANMVIRYIIDFEDSKSLEEVGNKLFLKPLLFLKDDTSSHHFKSQDRKYPLEFGSAFTQLKSIKFKIPEGYEVEAMPENLKFILDDQVGGYSIVFEEKDGFIVIDALEHIGKSVLPSTYYQNIKKMYQKILEKENEQIILKKL